MEVVVPLEDEHVAARGSLDVVRQMIQAFAFLDERGIAHGGT